MNANELKCYSVYRNKPDVVLLSYNIKHYIYRKLSLSKQFESNWLDLWGVRGYACDDFINYDTNINGIESQSIAFGL